MAAHLMRRRLAMLTGLMSLKESEGYICRSYGISRGYAQYWRREVQQLAHQRTAWGGTRYHK